MKIIKQEIQYVKFETLRVGEEFINLGKLYIKLKPIKAAGGIDLIYVNAYCINDKELVGFNIDSPVQVAKSKLTYQPVYCDIEGDNH